MFKKNHILFFLLFLFVAAAVFFSYAQRNIPSFSVKNRFCVVLDAGHGSPDGGAVGVNGTLEKDINLDVVLKLREILENKGIKVILTREGDSGIFDSSAETIHEKKVSDMKKRLDIINNSHADLFISIHMNSFTDTVSGGLHVFYSRNHPQSEETAIRIQEKISALTGAKTHAVKTASESLYLMKNPVPPSILVECGFLSNPQEEKLLNDENYRAKIAFAIAEAIEDI
jgi:N-acetylmuramoyl-L-alanine amidase